MLIFCVNRSGLLCWLWFCVGPQRPKPLVHRQVSIFSRQGICPWLCSMDLPWEDGLVWSEVSVLAWHMSIRVYPVKFSRQLRFLCQVSLRNQVLHTLLPSACATPQIHAQNTALCRQNPSTKTNDRHSPMSSDVCRISGPVMSSHAPLSFRTRSSMTAIISARSLRLTPELQRVSAFHAIWLHRAAMALHIIYIIYIYTI